MQCPAFRDELGRAYRTDRSESRSGMAATAGHRLAPPQPISCSSRSDVVMKNMEVACGSVQLRVSELRRCYASAAAW